MQNRKGSALLMVIISAALFTTLSALLVKMTYNHLATAKLQLARNQAFYLAEAGLEKGQVALKTSAGWFTDLPHSPVDDTNWLIRNAIGEVTTLETGHFKVVKEKSSAIIYSVGFAGPAVVVLKIDRGKEPHKWEII